MTNNEINLILDLLDRGSPPFALATLVGVQGSSYRRPGARMLIDSDGRHAGSISGGCLEDDVKEQAKRVLTDGQARVVVYDTTRENDLVWGVGLGCHGVATLFIERWDKAPTWVAELRLGLTLRRTAPLITVWKSEGSLPLGTFLGPEVPSGASSATLFTETIAPPPQLLLCGAGDDAQALARLAHGIGWLTLVCDPRPAYCTPARFPTASRLIVCPPAEVCRHVTVDHATVAVVMSHHYLHDVPFVRALLGTPSPYLGLLGPRKRALKIAQDVAEGGIVSAEALLDRLHAPVGLDLGADGPDQVALSVLAEIQATLSRRDARPLRNRTAPIHEA